MGRMQDSDTLPSALVQFDGEWHELLEPVASFCARTPAEVPSVLAEAEAAADAGRHVAGYLAYEAGAAFGLACHQPADGSPLAHFVAFEHTRPFDRRRLIEAAADAPQVDWQPSINEEEHARALQRIRRELRNGTTYQVNFTFPLHARFYGSPFALFARLASAQRGAYSAYLDFGRFVICSASPECYFTRNGSRVVMRPMKGTAPRGRTNEEDRRRARALRRSPKERAENLMIVDMVRNDLGQLAAIGSVRVERLFEVERFPTVLQMTSTVSAEVPASFADLVAATFPAASITGAPKVRTMELIREIEPGPRGVYTGAVGYLGPGGRASFNVAIRTAVVDRESGAATFGIGSGIVWDSRAGREYAECLAKAKVLSSKVEPFELLETLRWDPGRGYVLLERHLDRLADSARYFAFPFDREAAVRALDEVAQGDEPLRVRLLLEDEGRVRVEALPFPPSGSGPVRVGLASAPIDPGDPLLYHKTTHRAVYERAKASRPDCDQVLLWNSDGFVTETDIANLAVCLGGEWVTPPVSDGLLPGTLRAELIATGKLRERQVRISDFTPGVEIAVLNSVRGWQPATFVPAPDH